jgi:hypothetical protein
MFVAIERLLLKVRQPASRADELSELRQRVRTELAAAPDDEERALAEAVRARKLEVAAALHGVTSCATCASGQPWPVGHYAGGACCAGVTAALFDDAELAALVHAGTRTRDLTPPARAHDHAGCAFRGAHGCSLDLVHRPARCVHYICNTLRRELHARRELDAIEAELDGLNREMQRFTAVHRARADREVVVPILEAIGEASGRRTHRPRE